MSESLGIQERLDLAADGFMTIREAAELLSVSRGTIYNLMDRGELAYAKIGSSRRLPRRAVHQFAARAITGGVVEWP